MAGRVGVVMITYDRRAEALRSVGRLLAAAPSPAASSESTRVGPVAP